MQEIAQGIMWGLVAVGCFVWTAKAGAFSGKWFGGLIVAAIFMYVLGKMRLLG